LGSLYHNSAAIQKKDGQRPVFLTLFTPHTFYATHNPVYSRRTNPSFRAQPQRASSRSVIQSAGEAGAKNLLPSYPARLNLCGRQKSKPSTFPPGRACPGGKGKE
ncbi:hypothetical protein, partial [Luoshenia tenuis]|jgi:hypothetical protein|uniref:hypothetical protein n=1 Tax=Luoshenia tenuis TaxID=2763654 RepID=UPI003D9306E4